MIPSDRRPESSADFLFRSSTPMSRLPTGLFGSPKRSEPAVTVKTQTPEVRRGGQHRVGPAAARPNLDHQWDRLHENGTRSRRPGTSTGWAASCWPARSWSRARCGCSALGSPACGNRAASNWCCFDTPSLVLAAQRQPPSSKEPAPTRTLALRTPLRGGFAVPHRKRRINGVRTGIGAKGAVPPTDCPDVANPLPHPSPVGCRPASEPATFGVPASPRAL